MSEQFEQESIPKVNNNPFLPEERIHKMSFFLTTLVLSLIASCFYGVTEAGVVLRTLWSLKQPLVHLSVPCFFRSLPASNAAEMY